jgi:hypothetical protein
VQRSTFRDIIGPLPYSKVTAPVAMRHGSAVAPLVGRERQAARSRRGARGRRARRPWLTGIAPVLTPVAAICLLVLTAGAVKTHVDLKGPWVPPAVLGALCLFVALGRFGVF